MQRSILIVDEDDVRRRGIASSLAARGVRSLDVGDAFAGMAALGRADFGAVLAAEGRRTLSLRGLCQLARKRHPDILVYVLPKDGSTEDHIRSVLELDFEMIAPQASAERLVTDLLSRVEAAGEVTQAGATTLDSKNTSELPSDQLFAPELNPFEMPNTEDVAGVFDSIPRVEIPQFLAPPTTPGVDIGNMPVIAGQVLEAPAAIEMAEHTRPDLRLSSATQSADAPVVVDGHFEDIDGGAGAAFMMSAYAQELTGRLAVEEGSAGGTLYLYRGEPVWGDDPEGDAGLYRKLVQKQFLAPEQAVEPLPEGQLLGGLLQAGLLTSTQMHDFMREIVRDRVMAVAQEVTGTYRFTEDRSFLDTAPLLKVNPFGLILESRRRQLAPAALMALQSEIENCYVVPAPGLAAAAGKLGPFLRGADAIHVVDGQQTIKAILDSIGLDPFMGTLVMVAMRDARLVSFENAPRSQGMDLADLAFEEVSMEIGVVDAESTTEPPSSAEEAQAREDIYALYMRLKPLTQPRQVLGVGIDADAQDVDDAYQIRLRELDPKRIPEGSAQHILTQRIEELRRKVTSAYQTLTLQLSSATIDDDADDDGSTNPF